MRYIYAVSSTTMILHKLRGSVLRFTGRCCEDILSNRIPGKGWWWSLVSIPRASQHQDPETEHRGDTLNFNVFLVSLTCVFVSTSSPPLQKENDRHSVGKMMGEDDKMNREACESVSVILLGDANVGKTSLMNRFVDDRFAESREETEPEEETGGYENKSKLIPIEGVGLVLVNVWDTAGQERYHTLNRNFYQQADGALLVYDVTNTDSYSNIRLWNSELVKFGRTETIVGLVGNKSDKDDLRRVKRSEVVTENNTVEGRFFEETSAKDGSKVMGVFSTIVKRIVVSRRKKEKNHSTNRQARSRRCALI